MNVALFVLLAAPWLSPPGVGPGSPGTPGVSAPAAPVAAGKESFEVPRLPPLGARELLSPLGSFRKRTVARPGSETQLTGPTSGVTCTLRIRAVDPAIDSGILRPVRRDGRSVDDAIERRDLSPCLR
jgi:hypothetical protein